MKKITAFLLKKIFFKKGIKVLKNKKGFSLLEVLIGVTIIGIIGAIAVPRFQNYRETAIITTAVTSGKNIAKAYNLCTATRTSCTSLSELNISCETCGDIEDGATGFCVEMSQTISGKTFTSCVQVNKADGLITQKFGGDYKFCYGTQPAGPDNDINTTGDNTNVYIKGTPRRCDGSGTGNCPTDDGGTGDTKWTVTTCKAQAQATCSTAGVCQ